MPLSYAHGTSATPLLGETIGDNLRRTVARVPDADAVVVRSQGYRATYAQLYPREIEEFLYSHPAVSDAQVIGVPSATYGEEVMAWIVLEPGAVATVDELRAHCEGRIARYKVPRHWKIVDAFPMTVTGKVQKFRMRELAIHELGLGDAAAIETA